MKKSIGANTLIFPTPVWVVGSYDKDGKANVMTAAWGGVCCSKPPCIAVSLRRNRYTFDNISERHAFTINIPSETYAKEADYFGIVSGKKAKKFLAAGLTPVKSDLVDAPYVKEFPLILECKFIQKIELGVHIQFVGEIVDVKADEATLGESGLPEIEKVRPIIYAPGTSTYHGVGKYLGKAFSIGREILGITGSSPVK